MPANNICFARGNLVNDPYFYDDLNGAGTPYLRFHLAVPRDDNQRPRRSPPKQVVDVLRVVRYGEQAEVDYRYLVKGAEVAVFGWSQSRKYTDRKSSNKVRAQQEVIAETIVYGRGCTLERGDRWRREIAERNGRPLESVEINLVSTELLAQLAAEMAFADGD